MRSQSARCVRERAHVLCEIHSWLAENSWKFVTCSLVFLPAVFFSLFFRKISFQSHTLSRGSNTRALTLRWTLGCVFFDRHNHIVLIFSSSNAGRKPLQLSFICVYLQKCLFHTNFNFSIFAFYSIIIFLSYFSIIYSFSYL